MSGLTKFSPAQTPSVKCLSRDEYKMPVCYIIKKSGADVYVTVLCPPAKLIAERLAYRKRNGDDAWGRSLTNKIAIEYQEVAREIMLNIDCS